jgi:predicted nucleotidyltransferase component of viral defense system
MVQLPQNNWRTDHYKIIAKFMEYLATKSAGFVLKGGTALMMCYGLDRFSEDIDFDGYIDGMENIVASFTKETGTHYRTAKNTPTVQRYFIHYENTHRIEPKPLKIEVSYRSKWSDAKPFVTGINGISTYEINTQLRLKLGAFMGRDKIRDLYDIVFIGLTYGHSLNQTSLFDLKNALATRGLEHFDYVVKNQSDELINPQQLENNLLQLWSNLGLL